MGTLETPGNAVTILSDKETTASDAVIRMDPATDPRWERFVTGHPEGLIYHHPLWLQVLERSYPGLEPAHLAYVGDSGELLGILPLFWRSTLFSGTTLSSMPFTRIAGPLTNSVEVSRRLLEAAIRMVRDDDTWRLQIKTLGCRLDDVHEELDGGQWAETYILDVPDGPDAIPFRSSNRRKKVRTALRRAEANGIRVRQAESDNQLRPWYELYLQAMHRHCVPPRPFNFFRCAWEILRPAGLMDLWLVEQSRDDEPVLLAGLMNFNGTETVSGAFGGQRADALRHNANDVLEYHIIRRLSEDGYRRYDLGEAEADQEGLREFKLKWGTEPHWIYRYYFPEASELETGAMSSDGTLRRLTQSIWSKLPLSATEKLGGVIHRHV